MTITLSIPVVIGLAVLAYFAVGLALAIRVRKDAMVLKEEPEPSWPFVIGWPLFAIGIGLCLLDVLVMRITEFRR